MEARHRELVVGRIARQLLALAVLCAAAGPAVAQDGTAAGDLVIQGERVSLRYAYASAQTGFFDKTREDVRVVLSDVALDDNALKDPFALIHLARDGKLRAVEVVVDADRTPIGGAIYDRAFDGMISATGMQLFEATAFERARVAGRLRTRDVSSFRDVTFSYDVTFAAVIPRPPTAEEVARRLEAPPARTAAAFLDALRKGSLEELRKLLGASLAARFDGPRADAELSRLRAETPSDSHVVDVREAGNEAIATINGTRDGIVIEFALTLVERDNRWQVVKTE